MPALSDTFANSLDAPFRVIQTNVEEPGEKRSFQRCPDRRVRPASRQSRFDRKALFSSNVLRGPPKHFPSRRDPGSPRRLRPNAPGYGIGFQQVLSSLELDLPDQTALSGTVRPCKNRQDGHASGSRLIQLADHAVIALAGSAADEIHFEFATIRLFHDIQILLPISIENRNTGLERLNTCASTRRNNRRRKSFVKELAVLHVPIVDPHSGGGARSIRACKSD